MKCGKFIQCKRKAKVFNSNTKLNPYKQRLSPKVFNSNTVHTKKDCLLLGVCIDSQRPSLGTYELHNYAHLFFTSQYLLPR